MKANVTLIVGSYDEMVNAYVSLRCVVAWGPQRSSSAGDVVAKSWAGLRLFIARLSTNSAALKNLLAPQSQLATGISEFISLPPISATRYSKFCFSIVMVNRYALL